MRTLSLTQLNRRSGLVRELLASGQPVALTAHGKVLAVLTPPGPLPAPKGGAR